MLILMEFWEIRTCARIQKMRKLSEIDLKEKQQVETFNNGNIQIRRSLHGAGFSYFAKKSFKKGDVVMQLFGKVIDHQTNHYSVQIGYNQHILPYRFTGKYLNHSCEPSCYIQTGKNKFPRLVAKNKIGVGEEINFSYWMTEFEWNQHASENTTSCLCNTPACRNRITSYSQLSSKEKKSCKKYISTYLLHPAGPNSSK